MAIRGAIYDAIESNENEIAVTITAIIVR